MEEGTAGEQGVMVSEITVELWHHGGGCPNYGSLRLDYGGIAVRG